MWSTRNTIHQDQSELELELIQSHMAQKPMLRGEVGARALRVRSDVRGDVQVRLCNELDCGERGCRWLRVVDCGCSLVIVVDCRCLQFVSTCWCELQIVAAFEIVSGGWCRVLTFRALVT